MQQDPRQSRRNWLIIVAILAGAMEALKLVGKIVLLHDLPRVTEWSQPVAIAILLYYLWQGRVWAHKVALFYFGMVFCVAIAMLLFLGSENGQAAYLVSILEIAVTLNILLLLMFVKALR